MHTQTHILSGWCIANLFNLTARERLLCMVAAGAADLDGLSHLFGEAAFAEYHHKLCHGIFFGVLLAGVLMAFSTQRLKSGGIYLALFHLHLLMDYFGSGRGWTIFYLWPLSDWELRSSYVWAFYSWQNLSAAGGLVLWTVLIAIHHGRTPLEAMMPQLDRQLVQWLRKTAGRQTT